MQALDRPTVLVVGDDDQTRDDLLEALEGHGMIAEPCDVEESQAVAHVTAPDLLLLLRDSPEVANTVLELLALEPSTAGVPVAVLTDRARDVGLTGYRHGVVATIQRSDVGTVAREVLALARDLPDRMGETGGQIGDGSANEIVGLLSDQPRAGILWVNGEDGQGAQVVLHQDRPQEEVVKELVQQLRPLVAESPKRLTFEFHESPASRIGMVGTGSEAGFELLRKLRVLLVERNPVNADRIAQELRAHGALVLVTDGEGNGLERVSLHDPEVVVLDRSGTDSWARPALRAIRRDPRLRWASLLVVDAADLLGADGAVFGLSRFVGALRPLKAADEELSRRAMDEEAFEVRLEVLGPSRLLRALARTELGLRVSVRHPRVRVEVDLAETLVAGARAVAPVTETLITEGPAAIAVLLGLRSARVRVERKAAPATTNIMSPITDALAAASQEHPPVPPSTPPPSVMDMPTVPKADPDIDPRVLLGRFETLLERLQGVLPADVLNPLHAVPPPSAAPDPLPAVQAVIVEPVGEAPRIPSAPLPREAMASRGSGVERPTPIATASVDPAFAPVQVPGPDASRAARSREDEVVTLPPPDSRSPSAPPTDDPSRQPVQLPSRRATMTLGTVSKAGSRVQSEPPPAMRGAGSPEQPLRVPRPLSVPPPDDDEDDLEEIEAVAVPGKLTPPPTIQAISFYRRDSSGGAGLIPSDAPPPRMPSVPPSPGIAPPAVAAAKAASPVAARASGGNPSTRGALIVAAAVIAAIGLMAGIAGAVALVTSSPRSDSRESERLARSPAAPAAPPPTTPPTRAAAPPVDSRAVAPEPAPVPGGAPTVDVDALPPANGRMAQAVQERDIDYLIQRANMHRRHGELRDAEVAYARVLRMDPAHPRALAGLARVAMSREEGSVAVQYGRRLVEARPRIPTNHLLLGDAYELAGDLDAAREAWSRVLELDRRNSGARRRLAER